MLRWSVVLLFIALLAVALGFGHFSESFTVIARMLFYVLIVFFTLTLVRVFSRRD